MVAITATNSATPSVQASVGRARLAQARREAEQAEANARDLRDQADDAERSLAASAVKHAADFRQLHLFAAVGGKLEAAADALKHASLILREHILEHVIDG